ncbi:hypothetical protein SCP_1303870 [Sparassis crispa]|uniref:Uncharacterized protein n=1 Tax=Sparassis crispa TaxID=139825 RepID=A0A401H2I1_9APHY|nr:hypothetical protein SCP_1303870 [Sparassis crispa]GBE88570.1 hypothetical protein SCP_1303870 [Sparassis crispa]
MLKYPTPNTEFTPTDYQAAFREECLHFQDPLPTVPFFIVDPFLVCKHQRIHREVAYRGGVGKYNASSSMWTQLDSQEEPPHLPPQRHSRLVEGLPPIRRSARLRQLLNYAEEGVSAAPEQHVAVHALRRKRTEDDADDVAYVPLRTSARSAEPSRRNKRRRVAALSDESDGAPSTSKRNSFSEGKRQAGAKNIRVWRCPYHGCTKVWSSGNPKHRERERRKHLATHWEKDVSSKWKCPGCDAHFTRSYTLTKHCNVFSQCLEAAQYRLSNGNINTKEYIDGADPWDSLEGVKCLCFPLPEDNDKFEAELARLLLKHKLTGEEICVHGHVHRSCHS